MLAGLVLEDGRRWGEVAADFQWDDARAVLEGPAPYNFLTRSRGGSKTADLGGMAVAEMLATLPPGSRLYGLAADQDQGRILLDSVAGYAARTPLLRGALTLGAYRATATRGGSTLEILPADAASSWGLRPARLIVDEIGNWASTAGPRRLWESASSSAAKVPGSRMTVLTSAGDPSHWSFKIREHARDDPLWRVNEVPGPAPWLDPERLAEQRRRLPASSYLRLFENQWVASEDRLVSRDDLLACVVLPGPLEPRPGTRYVIALDAGLVKDRTVGVVAHAKQESIVDDEGEEIPSGVKIVLDRIEVWAGSRAKPVQLDDVEAWLEQAHASYFGARIVCDPWQLVGLAQRLRARGIRIDEFAFSSASVGRLASVLHVLLRNRQLELPDDEDLLTELANVRESSVGVLRLDHDAGEHDDRAVALALASQALLARAPYGPVTVGPDIYAH